MATNIQLLSAKRPTYPQEWPSYNAAEDVEREMFPRLLADLCATVPEPPPAKTGRPRLPLADAVYAATYKVYSTGVGRRVIADLRQAREKGFISRVPKQAALFNIFGNDALTPILKSLIEYSALPFVPIEDTFAVDSSGLEATRLIRYIDRKTGKQVTQHDWIKTHIACGTITKIVTAIAIEGPNAADTKFLPALVKKTAEKFHVRHVVADKGYHSKKNYEFVGKIGAKPFIAFPKNARGLGGGMYSKMYGHFLYNSEDFLAQYHTRSNVESAFSAIKRRFRELLRSRTDTAMKNEALCKFLCHNIVVLIHAVHKLGIPPKFSPAGSENSFKLHLVKG